MRRRTFLQTVVSATLIVTGSWALTSEAEGACEICKANILTPDLSWCHPVEQEETGVTRCRDGSDWHGPWCFEEGTFCSVVDAGGGGGTGGGGDNPCQVTGFCPAECFSCSGGGGGGGWAN